MTPEDYLRQYTEPFCSMETGSASLKSGMGLGLARGYYYPPYLPSETYLDTLSRADLLEIVQQLLATEYPAQRLIRRQIGEYLENLQRLKDERAWRQAEMERLNAELARCMDELVIDAHAGLESCQNQIAILESERATLNAMLADLKTSTSWKMTAPLRFISRKIRKII